MTLYIKQKMFSFGDKYMIYDANENPIYKAQGEVFSLGAKIGLLDLNDNELMRIEQKLLTFMPSYEIYTSTGLFAVLRKRFTFFYKKIEVESSYGDFVIDGDFWSRDYTISCNGNIVGSVSKQWLTWGDVYAMEIYEEHMTELFIAMVLTIDNILEREKN